MELLTFKRLPLIEVGRFCNVDCRCTMFGAGGGQWSALLATRRALYEKSLLTLTTYRGGTELLAELVHTLQARGSCNVKVQEGKKLPDSILDNFNGDFYVALFDKDFYIFVRAYESKKDIEAWKHGNIQFHISNIHSLLFFVFYLPEIKFSFDVPYDIHRTGITQEKTREGIRAVHLFLVDDAYILKAYRGIELSVETRDKIGEMLEKQWKEIQDPMLFDSLVNHVYTEYKTSEDMFKEPSMVIQWEKKSEIKA